MKHTVMYYKQQTACTTTAWRLYFSRMLLTAAAFLCFSLQAQYTTYQGNNNDRIYGSIAPVYKADRSIWGRGFVLASTALDPSASLIPNGEVIRTDASGNQVWVWHYNTGAISNWFNHIEKYDLSGSTEYLVVGSILDGLGNYNMLIARIDDNGNLVAQQQLAPTTLRHLVGIKGIATSDKNFALVAMECDGFDAVDSKQTIVLELDSLLNVLFSHAYNTPSVDYDFDMPTSIEEGADSSEFLIVGTSNKDTDPFWLPSSMACAMSTMIHMPTGNVNWSYNFSTAGGYHWDAGADGYFDPDDSTCWVLANSSVLHCFNLTQLNRVTGAVIRIVQYIDASYSGDLDNYGFELKPSLSDPDHFMVGGWKIIGQQIIPHLHEVDPYAGTVIWKFRYGNGDNRMAAYNDNNWLRVRAGGQFPFFYNNMMCYRSDKRGYAVLGSDTVNASGYEDPEFWHSIQLTGDAFCGVDTPWTDTMFRDHGLNQPLQWSPFTPNPTGPPLSNLPVSYSEKDCIGADGEAAPVLGIGQAATESKVMLYPNPASSVWNIESPFNLKQLSVYDLHGRQVMNLALEGSLKQQIDISHLPAGIYMVRILSGNEITNNTVQVMR